MSREINLRSLARFIFLGSLAILLCCSRPPTLEERIMAAALMLGPETTGKIPAGYERALVSLAKEPTPSLDRAFRFLDKERTPSYGGQPPNDYVWLTGTLVTILAFDCPPVRSRDWRAYHDLKSQLLPPVLSERIGDGLLRLKSGPAQDKMLAEWPWSDKGGAWHLLSIQTWMLASSDGAVAPLFEYYASHFKRRRLR